MISNLYSMKTVNNNLKKISIVLILLNSILVFYTAGLLAYELDNTFEPNDILPHMCSYLTINNDITVITDRNNEVLIRKGSLCFTRVFDSAGNAVDAFSSHISGHFTINAEDYEDITARFQDDEEYREQIIEADRSIHFEEHRTKVKLWFLQSDGIACSIVGLIGLVIWISIDIGTYKSIKSKRGYIGFNIVFMVLIAGLAIYLIINPITHQFFHIILQH